MLGVLAGRFDAADVSCLAVRHSTTDGAVKI